MTSKVALNKIQHDNGELKGQELVNCYETIDKNLDILEIFKNCFVIINDELMFSISPKQEEKIKEWLKDDTN